MSYSTVTSVLLLIVALSSALSNAELSSDKHTIIRLYPNFAQLFRPLKLDTPSSDNKLEEIQKFQFLFNENEYSRIAPETLTVLFTNITDRTIVHHRLPNFEQVGARYIYHRDPKETEGIQIELVNPEDRLFREVQRPNRYFYLTTTIDLEYLSKVPVMPYHEVTFICNNSLPRDRHLPSPYLSYVDKSFHWSPRYVIDLQVSDISNIPKLNGFADIHNHGDQPLTIEGLEFVAGDIRLDADSFDFPRFVIESAYKSTSEKDTPFIRSMKKDTSGTYVYETTMPSLMTLPPRSTKSIQFSKANVTIKRFHYYANEFQFSNGEGKLLYAYNITSHDSFIPNGPISLYLGGKFLGQRSLPDLSVGETFSVVFGYDADLSYERTVTKVEGDQKSKAAIYHVEYTFKNSAAMIDSNLNFIESFASLKHFEIQNTLPADGDFESQIHHRGTDLKVSLVIPHSSDPVTISYDIIMYKVKPTMKIRH